LSIEQQDRISRWAGVMRAAARVAAKATASEEELARALAEGLHDAELQGTLSLLTAEGKGRVLRSSLPTKASKLLASMAGIPIDGYQFNPRAVEAYWEVYTSREARFYRHRKTIIRQMMPPALRPLLGKIIGVVGDAPVIIAPLMEEGEVIGWLNVAGRWLLAGDLPMAAALADQISIALQRLRAQRALSDQLEQERMRAQIAHLAIRKHTLKEIADGLLGLYMQSSGAQGGALVLVDEASDTLNLICARGLPDDVDLRGVPRRDGVAQYVIMRREPLVIEDYPAHPNRIEAVVKAGVRQLVVLPLMTRDRVVAIVGLANVDADRQFDRKALVRIFATADVAGLVINNAQLFSQARRAANVSTALIESALAISGTLDYEEVLEKIAREAMTLFEAEGARIHLFDAQAGVLRCVVALQPQAEAIKAITLKPGEGLSGTVFARGEGMLVNRPADHPQALQVPGTPEDEPETLALAPLIVRNRSLGVMTLWRQGYERPFAQEDLELLSAFAAHAAIAIENANLYGQIGSQAQQLELQVAQRTQELRQSEARYRSLVENSLTGIFQLDAAGRLTYVNEQLAAMLGMARGEIIGRPADEFIHPEDQSMVAERRLARLRGERPPSEVYEIRLRARDGREIPVILSVGLIQGAPGEDDTISGLLLDISARKELEAALAAERDRLQAILTNVGDAVGVTDAQGRIEYVNPAWERQNGYSLAQVRGQTHAILKSGRQTEEFYADMWGTILAGKVWRGELVNRRKDGSLYDAVLTITPILGDDGEPMNFVGVHHDISTLKEIDRLKSQFVSDVSHELRTPLTNIRLYLDLLAQTEYDERAARYMETLSRESDRLRALIEDLLSLSRLESRAVSFAREAVDLNQLLMALAEDRERLLARRELRLELECEAKLPLVLGDEKLLTQVFTNLLTNATNYTPAGGKIALRSRSQQIGERTWVVVEVSDTGVGIPLEEQPMIFRRFFRGQASGGGAIPGTGLGLAICKEISEQHGGRITVASEGVPGRGSTFSVWLPAMKSLSQESGPASAGLRGDRPS
jgi:PAS domain S-box-containing protein